MKENRDEVRTETVRFRASPEEVVELDAGPALDGAADFSDWARETLLKRVRRLKKR